ncbi:MAG: formate--tetrahydrofolate ligase, partial [Bacilli bacterium]|nr:formate--tetrahydrofolate ligase [Bacilli bacterium]
TDIEIAQNCNKKSIIEIAKKINLSPDDIELYGNDKAKIKINNIKNNNNGKLILVTAMTPTKYGEGKTTTSIGLSDSLNKLNKKTILCLREPSLGPSFGMKGGACGGGYSQVIPMEDINLHFTGDIHAVTSAHNLISAIIDNSIYHGNELNIDPNKITWKRVLDLNDRALRMITIGLSDKPKSKERNTGFDISVASEIMAILCLSNDLMDLKERVSNIIIGYTFDDKPILVRDLGIEGSIALLLKDAIKPNLVQTLENNPVIIHGGPFANIAHGCNSIIATKTALKLADYVVTEAGFGADLGAEKFFDLKCRLGNIKPAAVVLVATLRAIKTHGNAKDINIEDLNSIKEGMNNLIKHVDNIKKYNLNCLVSINVFDNDNKNELNYLKEQLDKLNILNSFCYVYSKGSDGGIDLANKVISIIDNNNDFKPIYDLNLSIKEKVEIICKNIYGANNVIYSDTAEETINKINKLKLDNLPICIAKTQYSFSDNEKKLGVPENFDISITNINICSGAGFLVCIAGNIRTMPGLPKVPAAVNINIDSNGKIIGLF